jgi:hypothetical protein
VNLTGRGEGRVALIRYRTVLDSSTPLQRKRQTSFDVLKFLSTREGWIGILAYLLLLFKILYFVNMIKIRSFPCLNHNIRIFFRRVPYDILRLRK